jgi:hypothetical protein
MWIWDAKVQKEMLVHSHVVGIPFPPTTTSQKATSLEHRGNSCPTNAMEATIGERPEIHIATPKITSLSTDRQFICIPIPMHVKVIPRV